MSLKKKMVINLTARKKMVRWIVCTIMLVLLAINYYQYIIENVESIHILDYILFQLDDKNPLCFAILFIFIILIGDSCFVMSKRSLRKEIGVLFLISVTFLLLYLCVMFLVLFISGNGVFNVSSSILDNDHALTYSSALIALLILRFFSTALWITGMNKLFPYPTGCFSALLLNIVDYNFYYYLGIDKPLHLSAIEHSIITYDSIAYIDSFTPNIKEAFLYWGIVISILVGVIIIVEHLKHHGKYTINGFRLSVIIMVIFSLFSYFPMKRIMLASGEFFSNIDYFYSSVMSFNILPNTYAPVLAIVACWNNLFCEDRKEPCCLSIFFRTGIRGGGALTASLLLVLIIISVINPCSGSFRVAIDGTFRFAASNVVVYLLLFFGNTFLVGFSYSCLSYSLLQFGHIKWIAFCIPQIIYSIRLYNPFSSWKEFMRFIPIDSYDVAGKTRALLEHCLSIVLVFLLAIIFLLFTRQKERKTKK